MPTIKFCHKCKQDKPFGKGNMRKDGLQSWCVDCLKEYKRVWAASSKGKAYNRNRRLITQYGITLEQYRELSTAQNNVCAVCFGTSPNRTLDVDHDHKTGKVRGLLCNQCNQAIGLFEDNKDLLQKAIDYLSK